MSERLEIHLNNAYDDDFKPVSTARVMNKAMLVTEWQEKKPRELLYKAIEQSEPNVFIQMDLKKMVEKASTLFQATIVTIIPKD